MHGGFVYRYLMTDWEPVLPIVNVPSKSNRAAFITNNIQSLSKLNAPASIPHPGEMIG